MQNKAITIDQLQKSMNSFIYASVYLSSIHLAHGVPVLGAKGPNIQATVPALTRVVVL